jgi:hypothetical protein
LFDDNSGFDMQFFHPTLTVIISHRPSRRSLAHRTISGATQPGRLSPWPFSRGFDGRATSPPSQRPRLLLPRSSLIYFLSVNRSKSVKSAQKHDLLPFCPPLSMMSHSEKRARSPSRCRWPAQGVQRQSPSISKRSSHPKYVSVV